MITVSNVDNIFSGFFTAEEKIREIFIYCLFTKNMKTILPFSENFKVLLTDSQDYLVGGVIVSIALLEKNLRIFFKCEKIRVLNHKFPE